MWYKIKRLQTSFQLFVCNDNTKPDSCGIMSSRIQLLTPSALRLDSRLPLECRSISFSILPSPPSTSSVTPQTSLPPAGADGYAQVSHGLTKVSASIFGPREPIKIGPFSSSTGAQGSKGDKANVNVEIGVAGWSEKNVSSSSAAGGIRRGGRDRYLF
jgi:exosome complex component RRP41